MFKGRKGGTKWRREKRIMKVYSIKHGLPSKLEGKICNFFLLVKS